LATTGSDGKVVVWDIESGGREAEFPQRSKPIWSVAWSSDGGFLAAGSGLYDRSTVNGKVIIMEAPPDD
jgi:WD40 repeat protein